jgi:phosphoadenosine phosphosulfate reductase
MSELLPLPEFISPDDPEAILRAGLRFAGGKVTLACSFSLEDVLLIDLLYELSRKGESELTTDVTIFALDTGRLPEETYEVAEAVRSRYGVPIAWYFPDTVAVERLVRDKGLYSFRDSLADRKECCGIRKVEPLERALRGQAGWITGQRREHGVTRASLLPLEHDPLHGGILKINPLCELTESQLLSHAEARALPRNRLYARGYLSIGCAPCTRAVAAGESARAGRWWWESPEHKECGIHRGGL